MDGSASGGVTAEAFLSGGASVWSGTLADLSGTVTRHGEGGSQPLDATRIVLQGPSGEFVIDFNDANPDFEVDSVTFHH